jgi:hypothetical protein
MDTSLKALQEAIAIRRQIDNLERRLSAILKGAPPRPARPTRVGHYFSPRTRAKLSATAKARWARLSGTARKRALAGPGPGRAKL